MTETLHVVDKYKYINKIGSGSFGEVFVAQDKQTKKIYAAKIEQKENKSRLKIEYNIYRKLIKNKLKTGIPKIVNYIETSKQNILIMQLLGSDLGELHKDYNDVFDVCTVLKLGISIITLLENVHKAGFIHRDIKPNNFTVGKDDDVDNIYIMDFGLSKQYISKNVHIPYKVEKDLVGTARYASINVHDGIEPSRRDDLESVGYMLIYFIKGLLPWQGLKGKGNKDKIKLIGDTKRWTGLTKLCNSLPNCFSEYVKYCRKLEFTERPDYDYLRNLFINEAKLINNDLKYCWIDNNRINNQSNTSDDTKK